MLSLLIQIPYVQNLAINRISQKVSRDLGTHVSIEHLHLNFFDDLLVDNLLIKDESGDTLLYSRRAYFDIDRPLSGLLDNRLVFQQIDLQDSKCYLKTDSVGTTNYQFLLDYLKRNTENPTGEITQEEDNPFRLIFNPARIALDQIEFTHANDFNGRNSHLRLPFASAQLEKISSDDPLHFRDVSLLSPSFTLEKFPTEASTSSLILEDSKTEENSTQLRRKAKPLSFTVDFFDVTGGQARIIDGTKPKKQLLSNVIDLRDVSAYDINIEIEEFDWYKRAGQFSIDHLELKTPEGFLIKELTTHIVEIDTQQIHLDGLFLQTANSIVKDNVKLRYGSTEDFKDFENRVKLDINLANSKLALIDILHFANNLNRNEFFLLNGGKAIAFTGRLTGTINDLSAKNLHLQLADKGTLHGQFRLENITEKGSEALSLNLDSAALDILTLRQLIPNFNPPENYNKLGMLYFTGTFDGPFQDFRASGNLKTDLGQLRTNMRLSTGDSGIRNASYQGDIQLIDFDLAAWTGSDLYGLASFSAEVKNGQNLNIEDAYANLYAKLDTFHYKGYNYHDAIFQGELNKSFFNGQFYINDPNASLDFSGSVDFADSIPTVDFVATVRNIDFAALNISEKPLVASGDIDFNFDYHDLYNLDGFARGYNVIILDDTTTHVLDTVEILSVLGENGQKILDVDSDILDFHLQGIFDLELLPTTVEALFQHKHPRFAQRIRFADSIPDSLVANNDFVFFGTLDDSKGLQKLINRSLGDFKEIALEGHFKNEAADNFEYNVDLEAPLLQMSKNRFDDLVLKMNGQNEKSVWHLEAANLTLGKQAVKRLLFEGTMVSDSLLFSLETDDIANVLSEVDVGGLFYLNDSLFQFDLANTSFRMLNEPWEIVPNNYIQLGNHFVRTQNMVFLSDDSYLRITSPGDNSLALEAEKIDISFLDDFLKKDQLKFSGDLYSTLTLENLFARSELNLDLSIDSIRVNNDDYGQLTAAVVMDDIDHPAQVELNILDLGKAFNASGIFFVPLTKKTQGQASEYQFNVDIQNYPLKIAEYFIGHSISNTEGTVNATIELLKEDDKPAIYGPVILDGSLKIDYLGTTYSMDKQLVQASPTIFDFSDAMFYDELGNKAEIEGGIIHNYFKKFGLDAVIASPHFQFLNTEKNDNALYYGTGIGDGNIEFTGNFKRTNMRIQATTGDQTKLYIPVEDDYVTGGDAFIKFVFDQDSSKRRPGIVDLRGINLDMQLNITPEAEVQIIFDEFSGDIIQGTGTGSLNLTIERGGNFQMTGKYVIDQGQYLYTLLDFINKPFLIERGGVITWTGDPLAADLNMNATYTGLKVPPRNLIAEYLESGINSSAADAADITTQVDLVLSLQGILSQPQIGFDIQFPEIDPSLNNYIDSKLRILKEDASELNRQVYGLLFFNSFLPPSINLDLAATTVNTLSEFITSQLSNYVAAYITQGVEEVDYISGVDFYFDYNFYRSEDFIQGQETGVRTGSEFSLAPNIRFFDDRLAFSPGASIIEGTILQGSTFIGGDVKLDFYLTDDKRLKLSLFYKRFPSLGGSRNKVGLGFRFSKSYDSMGEIFGKAPGQDTTAFSPELIIREQSNK
ncbi:MAG: hypothetical protein HKN87_03570 [Saprospiraceae bacterium]|nr:hypothetical protein [Saprospiraceae bacterium]